MILLPTASGKEIVRAARVAIGPHQIMLAVALALLTVGTDEKLAAESSDYREVVLA